jgi:hypothetical protein
VKSGDAKMELASRYLDGRATEAEVAELERLMRDDRQLREDFLAYARLDASLPVAIAGSSSVPLNRESSTLRMFPRIPVGIAAAMAIITAVLAWKAKQAPEVVAQFVELEDCRWMEESFGVEKGDTLVAGQRVELSAGSVEILFKTGAKLQLLAPAIAKIRDKGCLFLSMGEARLVAETPEAKGFTIITPSSKFIDISTAFIATVSPDGLSRLDVSEGEVDVHLGGNAANRRLKAGEALYVEPGEKKILTRIEQGGGTKDFSFPTIPPPGTTDFADQSQGHAHAEVLGDLGKGADLGTLLDGKGQSRQDSPEESVYFTSRAGSILIDLGQTVQVVKVNTYSWHQHNAIPEHRERARQKFTLFGFAGEQPPGLGTDPLESGWQRIARVNSDKFFHVLKRLDRPAQQACSISAAEGNIGQFSHLLIEIHSGTFFGEIDVFAEE